MGTENFKEIRTAEEFAELRNRGEGYIVIAGQAEEGTIHEPSCAQLTEARFAENALSGKPRGEKYFWTNDLDFAQYKWDAYKCGNCLR